jgi:hypothetical protein
LGGAVVDNLDGGSFNDRTMYTIAAENLTEVLYFRVEACQPDKYLFSVLTGSYSRCVSKEITITLEETEVEETEVE